MRHRKKMYHPLFNSHSFNTINEFLNELADAAQTVETKLSDSPSLIRSNVEELEDKFILKLELPGLNKKDVKLDIEDQWLSISIEKSQEEKDINFIQKEFDYSSSRRKFKLSKAIDISKIEAEMKDGILSIHLNKKEAFVPKEIKIK